MSVEVVNANTSVQVAGGSFSSNFTVSTTGPNHCAIASVSWDDVTGLSVTAITLGGRTMTPCGVSVVQTNGGHFGYVQHFYLMNPPTGTPTLAITVSGGTVNEVYANLNVFAGVDADHPIANYTTAIPTGGATGSLDVTSTPQRLTVTCATTNNGTSLTATNQTLLGVINALGTHTFGNDRCTTGAGLVTHTWTADGVSNWAIAGFALQEIQTQYMTRNKVMRRRIG